MSPDLFQAFALYNTWMNQSIYEKCAVLGDEKRKKISARSLNPFMAR